MRERIGKLANDILDDIEKLRESDMELKDRISIEFMTLNAVVNSAKFLESEKATD